MRAMILREQGLVEKADRLVLEDIAVPEVKPGEVRVRVIACGVCRTDLHIIEGDLPLKRSPLVVGHQIIGVVEEVGRGVSPEWLGKRVGIPWFQQGCGECRWCRSRQENLCPDARFNGYHTDGGFAEFVTVPTVSIYEVPASYEPVEAAPLMCAGVIGFRALKACSIGPDSIVALFGFGASAHIVLQIAVARKNRVFVISRNPDHRQLAQDLGAEWTGTTEDKPPEAYDAAIVFAPVGQFMVTALRGLAPAGRVVSAGIHMTPIPQFEYRLLYEERVLTSVANSTHQDVRDLLSEAGQIKIHTKIQTWPLEKANDALRSLKTGKVNGAAVLTV